MTATKLLSVREEVLAWVEEFRKNLEGGSKCEPKSKSSKIAKSDTPNS